LAQEATISELKKEVETLKEELKASSQTVSVLVLSLVAAEEFVRETIPCC
jgi:cell division septum initiation protein DivIVA